MPLIRQDYTFTLADSSQISSLARAWSEDLFAGGHVARVIRSSPTRSRPRNRSGVEDERRARGQRLLLASRRLRQLPHHLIEVEARGFLAGRKFLKTLQPHRDQGGGSVIEVNVVHKPLVIEQ